MIGFAYYKIYINSLTDNSDFVLSMYFIRLSILNLFVRHIQFSMPQSKKKILINSPYNLHYIMIWCPWNVGKTIFFHYVSSFFYESFSRKLSSVRCACSIIFTEFYHEIQNDLLYSYVSNKRGVSNKHPGLDFTSKIISVLDLINVLAWTVYKKKMSVLDLINVLTWLVYEKYIVN